MKLTAFDGVSGMYVHPENRLDCEPHFYESRNEAEKAIQDVISGNHAATIQRDDFAISDTCPECEQLWSVCEGKHD